MSQSDDYNDARISRVVTGGPRERTEGSDQRKSTASLRKSKADSTRADKKKRVGGLFRTKKLHNGVKVMLLQRPIAVKVSVERNLYEVKPYAIVCRPDVGRKSSASGYSPKKSKKSLSLAHQRIYNAVATYSTPLPVKD